MTKIRNMFRALENLNFVIVSACDELSRFDFEFRASNFTKFFVRAIHARYYWDNKLEPIITKKPRGSPFFP